MVVASMNSYDLEEVVGDEWGLGTRKRSWSVVKLYLYGHKKLQLVSIALQYRMRGVKNVST